LATSASLASVAIVPDAAAPAAATSTIKVELAAINTIAMWNVRCGKRNTLRANAATCYKFTPCSLIGVVQVVRKSNLVG
jgi:hypothetical protein